MIPGFSRAAAAVAATLALSSTAHGFTTPSSFSRTATSLNAVAIPPPEVSPIESEVTTANPLKVIIAGAGVGGLALANVLSKNPKVEVVVLERTDQFKRFGGPIQLASNALQVLKEMDSVVFDKIMDKFTYTGDKENGIKDGIRTEWYAKFDLGSPAEKRKMPYTGVIDRPDLQEILLNSIPKGVVQNGNGVKTYSFHDNGRVIVTTDSGTEVEGDVLIGADGIWSAVRAHMRGEPIKGEGSGASYSGYTVFAGELKYDSPDNGRVGYKVYIGPGQYFVITDIGNGNYQWYAFLARPPGSVNDEKPDGSAKYLQDLFAGWSEEVHAILRVTKENEIEQRDLYDRPPSAFKPWTDKNVALLGDGIHAMMPNLGQGGCQAIEDAYVIAEELGQVNHRHEVPGHLNAYQGRRLIRSAAVQGLSRFASDIIIRGFDTPAKIVVDDGRVKFENFNYAGIVTKMLQPILPIFFIVQFNFLYDGYQNKSPVDLKAGVGILVIGGLIAFLLVGAIEEAGLAGFLGFEAFSNFDFSNFDYHTLFNIFQSTN